MDNLSMVKNLPSFLNWLRAMMGERDITPADIARTGYVTDSAVSLLLSMKTKSVSFEMCQAIAKAADIPLIVVFQAAGILPEDANDNAVTKTAIPLLRELPSDDQREILEIIRVKHKLSESRQREAARRSTRRTQPAES
jgi:transcriptional regulator with XRE-family HTH domain